MYNVTEEYKIAIKKPVQYNKITFTLNDEVYDEDNILTGSFSISNQCTDSQDIKLGSVYTAELTATLRGVNIDRNAWVNKVITPIFKMQLEDESFESVPLGVYTISEATWTRSGVDVTAYDNMAKFDKPCSMIQSSGYLYDFLTLATEECHVPLAHTQEDIEAMTNGNIYLSYYKDSDVETWRDLIFWCAQITGGFATINRNGELELRHYGAESVDTLDIRHREADSKFSDYTTKYTSFSYVDLANQVTKIVSQEVNDGSIMNLGSNPFLQTGSFISQITSNLLSEIIKIQYVPFESATIGNPAYDLGDVITFEGGLAGETSQSCMMKYVFSYHDKFEIAGFGANPELASAKSKVEKNISGLLNNVKGDVMNFYEYQNASPINISSGERRNVFRLKIAATADTRVQIHMNICLQTTSATETDPTSVIASYTTDGVESALHPKETYIDGYHVMHLMYIMPISANVITNFRLYFELNGGSAFIDRRGIWVYGGGYGVVGDATWDGTIDVDEEVEKIPIIALTVASVTESVRVETGIPIPITASDTTSALTIINPTVTSATEDVILIRHSTAKQRVTEDGRLRILENIDGATEVVRYTEEEI